MSDQTTGGFQTPGAPPPDQADPRPWRSRARRTATWSFAAAVAILGLAIAVAFTWRHDLPDPIATHWGANGQIDDFGSFAGTVFGIPLGLGLPLSLGMAAIGWFVGNAATSRRLSAGLTTGTATFISGVVLGVLWVQRGLADAHEAGSLNWPMLVSLAAALAVGVGTACLVRGDPPLPARDPVAEGAAQVPLAQSERAIWFQRISMGKTLTFGITGFCAGMGVIMALITREWFVLVMFGLIPLVVVSFSSATVRVDAAGLTIRGLFGWPKVTVPADEILVARVENLSAFSQYGGWGFRVNAKGTVGVIFRSGDAIIVERTGERRVAVTVDDAATGAALLNTYAARSR
jgi:hypothetical protein